MAGTDISVGVRGFSDYTLLIAKKDPGKPIVWAAFAALITGIFITFYRPRRGSGLASTVTALAIVARSDRYVDVEREFGRLLDDLVASGADPSATDPRPRRPRLRRRGRDGQPARPRPDDPPAGPPGRRPRSIRPR